MSSAYAPCTLHTNKLQKYNQKRDKMTNSCAIDLELDSGWKMCQPEEGRFV